MFYVCTSCNLSRNVKTLCIDTYCVIKEKINKTNLQLSVQLPHICIPFLRPVFSETLCYSLFSCSGYPAFRLSFSSNNITYRISNTISLSSYFLWSPGVNSTDTHNLQSDCNCAACVELVQTLSPCEAVVANVSRQLFGNTTRQRLRGENQLASPDPRCRPQAVSFSRADKTLQLRCHVRFSLHVNRALFTSVGDVRAASWRHAHALRTRISSTAT